MTFVCGEVHLIARFLPLAANKSPNLQEKMLCIFPKWEKETSRVLVNAYDDVLLTTRASAFFSFLRRSVCTFQLSINHDRGYSCVRACVRACVSASTQRGAAFFHTPFPLDSPLLHWGDNNMQAYATMASMRKRCRRLFMPD